MMLYSFKLFSDVLSCLVSSKLCREISSFLLHFFIICLLWLKEVKSLASSPSCPVKEQSKTLILFG